MGKLWVMGYGPAFQCCNCDQFWKGDQLTLKGKYFSDGTSIKYDLCPNCAHLTWEYLYEMERMTND